MSSFKSADGPQIGEEFASGDEFKNEVNVARVLAKAFEVDDERMLEVSEDGVLVNDMVHLFEPDNFCFFELLQGDVFIGCFVPGELNPAKRPFFKF
jgi:hypothetical protein